MKFLVPLVLLVTWTYASVGQSYMNSVSSQSGYVNEYYIFKEKYDTQNNSKYTYSYAGLSPLRVDEKINEHLYNYYNKNYSVSFNSSYVDNFGNIIGELGLFYNRALQAGVEWSILKDGYLDKKQQYKAQSNYYRAKIYNAQKNQSGDLLKTNKALIDSVFEIANKVHYTYFNSFLTRKKAVYRNLYSRKLTSWTELINLDNQESNISIKLNNLKNIKRDDSLFIKIINSNFYKLNTDHFFDFAIDSGIYYTTRQYAQQATLLQNISLKTSLRYNYFVYDAKALNRDFVSLGVGLSIPIFSRLKDLNALNKINAEIIELQNKSTLLQQQQQLRELITEYNIVLEELINIRYNGLIIDENIRKELVKNGKQDPDFSPVAVLNFTQAHYENAGNFLFQKRELDKLSLQIATIVGEEKFRDALAEVDFTLKKPNQDPSSTVYNTKTQNSVYVWSKTFEKYSINQMLAEMASMNADKVIISINKNNQLKLKLMDFAKAAKAQKIETIAMIGKNSFIYPQNKKALIDEINYLSEIPNITEIHLDVEPHTIASLKPDRDKYLSMYVTMLKHAKEALTGKNIKLSISIPLFYEEKYLSQIFELTDYVYLMSYEHTDVSFVNKKIAEEKRVSGNKIILSVRTKDFESRKSMFSFMNKLSETSQIKRVAIHDMESWLITK